MAAAATTGTLFNLPLQRITGERTSLAEYRGKVLLIVNVASKCGLTPQYDALEKLYARYKSAGLVVLGFPANDFAAQEPGSNEEIQTFCRSTFGVDFPMFGKIAVTGTNADPLYKMLTAAKPQAFTHKPGAFRENLEKYGPTRPEPEVLWNFEKFLIGRDGQVIARFSPEVLPDDPAVVAAIEAALNA